MRDNEHWTLRVRRLRDRLIEALGYGALAFFFLFWGLVAVNVIFLELGKHRTTPPSSHIRTIGDR